MSAGSVLQFPLLAGIDEGIDPKGQQPGRIKSLGNVAWLKDGRLDKRAGTRALSKTRIDTGGSLLTGARLVAGPVLGVADNDNLYSYRDSVGWTKLRQLTQYTATWDIAIDTALGIQSWDVTICGTCEVLAWTSGDPSLNSTAGAAYIAARDTTTGALVLAPTPINFVANSVRVVSDGSSAFILCGNGQTGALRLFSFTPSTGSLTTAVSSIATNLYVQSLADLCVIGATVVVAWVETNLSPNVRFTSYVIGSWTTAAGGTLTGEGAGAGTAYAGLAIDGDANDAIYVAYHRSTATAGIKVATIHPTTLVVINAPIVIETSPAAYVGVAWRSAGNVVVTYQASDSGGFRATSSLYTSAAGGSVDTTTRRGTFNAFWASRPLIFDGRIFATMFTGPIVPSGTGNNENPTLALVEIETSANVTSYQPHRHLDTIDVLIGGITPSWCHPRGYLKSATEAVFATPFQSTLSASGNVRRFKQGLRRVTLKRRANDYARSASYGGATYIAGGLLGTWDGARFADLGFAQPPTIVGAVAAAGGSMTAGTYTYSVVAEYRDSSGCLQRSPPALPLSVVVTASQKVTLTITSECLSHHETDLSAAFTTGARAVSYAIYRTTANGTILYRLTVDPSLNTLANNPFAPLLTYADLVADTNIDGSSLRLDSRPLIYTTGGILEDRPPISFTTTIAHNGRLWGIDGSRRQLFYSKLFSDDPTVAAAFPTSFYFVFDEELVGLGSMDDKLVVFTTKRMFVIYGDGPAANGTNSNFQGPIIVQSDVGCSNPKSIVSTPAGIMFQSSRGIYVITRGLEVSWVGKPVQDTLAAYPNVTSAVLVAAANQIRFTCNDATSTTGRAIVFDYIRAQWSVFAFYDTDAGVAGTPIADACVFSGVWTFLTPNGQVFQDDATTYLDGGSAWVTGRVELADISADGAVGFQRVRRAAILADRFTDCDVTLSFAFNGASSFPQAWTWTSDKLSQLGDGANVGMRVGSQNGASPRCRAFRLAVQDAAPTGAGAVIGTGQGINLSAIGLEIVPKPGLVRRSARARA